MLHDVRLSRTGDMVYGPGQIPVTPGPDGKAIVTRDDAVVFAADALASFVGKPVTIGHPTVSVTPANWKDHASGHILSARRGSPPYADFMVGDVLVTSPEAIQLAEDGCEISCGYDAAYEEISPGRGRQTRIIGNHLAFLPDGKRGRCGPMCYVGDCSMDVEEPKMTDKTQTGAGVSLLRKLFGAKDEAAVQAVLDEAAVAERDQVVATKDAQIAALQAQLAAATKTTKDDDKGETEDEKKAREAKEAKDKESPTMDAATVAQLHTRTAAGAEILSPGLKLTTMDAASDVKATFDAICACQKLALDNALKTPTGKTVLESLVPGFDTSKMTADQIGANFFAAASMMGAGNNAALSAALAGTFAQSEVMSNIERSSAAQKRSDDRWGKIREARQTQH